MQNPISGNVPGLPEILSIEDDLMHLQNYLELIDMASEALHSVHGNAVGEGITAAKFKIEHVRIRLSKLKGH
ncbi:hypothetical protein [Paracoccus onubensis]|uniref:Uncharacterized protein n=1 Tax=Paracoccus onubensis TaxID=1675788 RepID=A0A418SX45_9RHOB|nr:hypothetical protein [Paracoccus onubensis]RJE85458.1 hypothetical protein D3P04_10675 [Paracoccus onubensis]